MRIPLFICSLLFYLGLAAQPLRLQSWTVAEGLPFTELRCVAVGPQGYLWAGSREGLIRFDGTEFAQFGADDGLADERVTAVVNWDSTLLVGTQSGLLSATSPDGPFLPVALRIGGPSAIRSLIPLPDGSLVVTVDDGYYRFGANSLINGTVEKIESKQKGLPPTNDALLLKDGLLTATQRGLYLGDEALAKDQPYSLNALARIGDKIFLSLAREGLAAYDRVRDTIEVIHPELLFPTALSLHPMGDRLLIGSETEGLFLVDPEGDVVRNISEQDGLPGNTITDILVDDRQGIWITTNGGLARLWSSPFRKYEISTTALDVAPNGKVWAAGRFGRIYSLDTATVSIPQFSYLSEGQPVTALADDGRDRLYFGLRDRGLAVVEPDSQQASYLDYLDTIVRSDAAQIIPVSLSRTRVLTAAGQLFELYRRDGRYRATELIPLADQPDLRFTTALAGPRSGFFLGVEGGGLLYGTTNRLRPALDPEKGLPAANVIALGLRRRRQLWAAVEGHGLYFTDIRQQPLKFYSVEEVPGLPRGASYGQLLALDKEREVWAVGEGFVDRLFLDEGGQPLWSKRYSAAEGFDARDITPGAAGIGVATGSSRSMRRHLWFGSPDGLYEFVGDDPDSYVPPPPTRLTQLSVFYDPIALDSLPVNRGRYQFSTQQNHLNFSFTAVDLVYPERIRYRYRLVGLDKAWSPATAEHSVRYAQLAPGLYSFEAASSIDDGKTWGEPLQFGFAVDGPWWRKSGFLLAVAGGGSLLLVGVFALLFTVSTRRIRREETAKRQKLMARNRVLELEQRALRLQMNPHFLFNTLNGIRGLIGGDEGAAARRQLTRFATLMRGILNNSRVKEITLAAEVATLRDYLELELFCQPFPFSYTINLPSGHDPEEILLPPMLIQPFVENAILHGLAGRKGGQVDIGFTLLGRGRRMECTIIDNGIGRVAASAKRGNKKHQSVALQVTRDRLKAVRGHLDIIDLYNDQGRATGTKISLAFNVNFAW